MQFNIPFKKRLLMLLFSFLVCYFLASVAVLVVTMKWSVESTPAMRIVAMLQDILLFIMPALVTAVVATRYPADLLAIDRKPMLWPMLIGICTLVCSVPAMNLIVQWNEQLPLPDGLAQVLREAEDRAGAMVEAIQGPHTWPNLVVSILIVAVFAGFSEELLFRGCFQRLLSTGGVKPHAAVWIAAVVFSLMHLQAYGFVPRMLLGAFFGYALLWTRCLWIPIVLHCLNNTFFLIGQWLGEESAINSVGADNDPFLAIISAILTGLGLYLLRRSSRALVEQTKTAA